ncbi:MAG TPA: hypothetical protein VIL46_18290 [Gemmataceae bacterium]
MPVYPYKPGDPVIYRKTKHGTHPGRRARQITPAPHGDTYSYVVEKLWVVDAVEGDTLVLRTRRGKTHRVRAGDANVRPAHWWERWLYRGRFPNQPMTPRG